MTEYYESDFADPEREIIRPRAKKRHDPFEYCKWAAGDWDARFGVEKHSLPFTKLLFHIFPVMVEVGGFEPPILVYRTSALTRLGYTSLRCLRLALDSQSRQAFDLYLASVLHAIKSFSGFISLQPQHHACPSGHVRLLVLRAAPILQAKCENAMLFRLKNFSLGSSESSHGSMCSIENSSITSIFCLHW